MRFGLILGLIFLNISVSARAEEPARTSSVGQNFSLQLENDLFGGNSDRHYTHGTRAEYVSAENAAPEWLRDLAENFPLFSETGASRYSFAIGQSMFTPSSILVAAPTKYDRPYAGWAYGSFGLMSDGGDRLDNIEFTLGMVGKNSQAGKVQKWIHRHISNSPDPQGWDTQLANELGVNVTYERMWRIMRPLPVGELQTDIIPNAGVALGNVFTHVNGGFIARFGTDLPSDYGPPRIQPSMPGSAFFKPSDGFSWYFFAGLGARAVARNIFLDGNTFRDSHSVDKRPLVGDVQGGLVLGWGDFRLSYTRIGRTEEYKGQQGADEFASLNFSLAF